MSTRYQVVTGVPDMDNLDEAVGNLAACMELWETNYVGMPSMRVSPLIALGLRKPVFHVGELLVVDGDGREYGYPGRKASKWDVTVDEFNDLTDAIERVRELDADERTRGLA